VDSMPVGTSATPGASPAIVLAAGASTRFVGGQKALAPIDGVPAIAHVVRTASGAGFDPVLAVVGPQDPAVAHAAASAGARVILHPGWASGRTGSLKVGLSAVGPADAVLVWPIDHPFASGDTAAALRSAGSGDALATWVLPTFRGRGGHPVYLKSPVYPRIHDLSEDAPLRSLLPGLGAQVLRVTTEDPGVVANADTQEAFALGLSEWRRRRI
jgi:CTP:molybdopterin cytidylyltransferase MocA